VGKLRAQLGHVTGTRGTWIVCSLLLASGLLAGCNDSSSTSASNAMPSASSGIITRVGSDSISTSSGSTSTSSSPPAATDKSVDVTWTAPTANTNGSALTDLAGYTIYYGTSPTALTRSVSVSNAGATDYVVQGLGGGTWYFAVRAYTSAGLQSSYSAIISRTIT
jgi:hypothetical protein